MALLSDSYQTFDARFVEERLDEYASARGLSESERGEIEREFAYVTIQRKLKDAGRFVYIDRVRGDSSYLKYVQPTIAMVRAALQRVEHDPTLRELTRFLAE